MQNTPYAAQQRQVNKFLEATRKLGAQMDQDQGTTRIIYDTTGLSVGLTSYSFFNEVTSKNFPATNLDQNRFQPGEGMVIKEISLVDLNSQVNFSTTTLSLSVIDFYIGNNRVLKGLPLTAFSTIAALNVFNRTTQNLNGQNQPDIPTAIRLRTNLVIPPMVQFRCDIRFPVAIGAGSPNQVNIKMAVKGYGKLFNPNANY